MAIAENSCPQKIGHSCLKILDPKICFQVKFQTQKHGTHTPICKDGKWEPASTFGIIITCI